MIITKDQIMTLLRTWGYCDGLRIGGDASETISDVICETPCCHCRTRGRSNKLGLTTPNQLHRFEHV